MSQLGVPTVAIYIYGDELDTDRTTMALRVTPTKSWRRGDLRPSKRQEGGGIAGTGLWMLRSQCSSTEVSDHIRDLLKQLDAASVDSLMQLPGVCDAKIDVYIQGEVDRPYYFEMPVDLLRTLASKDRRLACTYDCIEETERQTLSPPAQTRP